MRLVGEAYNEVIDVYVEEFETEYGKHYRVSLQSPEKLEKQEDNLLLDEASDIFDEYVRVYDLSIESNPLDILDE